MGGSDEGGSCEGEAVARGVASDEVREGIAGEGVVGRDRRVGGAGEDDLSGEGGHFLRGGRG